MPERMLKVTEVDWPQLSVSTREAISFLLRKDIAVYIKVRRDSEIVYHHYHVPFAGVAEADSADKPLACENGIDSPATPVADVDRNDLLPAPVADEVGADSLPAPVADEDGTGFTATSVADADRNDLPPESVVAEDGAAPPATLIADADWINPLLCTGLLATRAHLPPDAPVAGKIGYRILREVESIDSLPYAGYSEELAFLSLGEETLAEIAVSRSCHVSRFSGTGFSMPNSWEAAGQTRGGYSIKKQLKVGTENLTKVEFDYAFIVEKKMRDLALSRWVSLKMPAVEQFAIQIEVGENDLYLTSSDFEALKQGVRQDHELIKDPLDNATHRLGIYWMFQAAYALNDRHLIGENQILGWLRDKCGADVFKGKRGGFAAKLVPKELNRTQGRKGGPRPFKMSDLKHWAETSEQFIFPFASDGLTLALAVTKWWVERLEAESNESRVVLAKKLYEQNFDQVETNYLVFLIAGVQLSKAEKNLLADWAKEKGKKEMVRALRDA